MIFGEWGADISIIIALILAVSTVIKNYRDNKRSIEVHTPIFIVEKIESFEQRKYTLLIRNIKDNFFVIKNVISSNQEIDCKYEGVKEIELKQTRAGETISRQLYKGHAIEILINTSKEVEVFFDIKGVTLSNRKFVVRTPKINFMNYTKQTISIQDRYLEFIKK